MSVNIVIADNQYLTRQGLKAIVRDQYGLEVKEADSHDALVAIAKEESIDLLIVDYGPKEFDVIKFKEHFPDVKVLAIAHDYTTLDKPVTQQTLVAVVKTGIDSHITKDCSEEEFIDAIQATLSGSKFFCNQILNIVLDNKFQKSNCDFTSLTPREIDIVKCSVDGLTAKQTAEKLFLSYHTVNTHRKNIMKKLGFKTSNELILYAVNTGLISE